MLYFTKKPTYSIDEVYELLHGSSITEGQAIIKLVLEEVQLYTNIEIVVLSHLIHGQRAYIEYKLMGKVST